ncbi:hypothetical protein C8P63_105169 [Melghirimyces profundicolus]|uniref:Uncharacterized protein n=1 Tax=Melghirimyces profundicolus TaxID=1242148 RepID=A0A2T6C2L6_9BACL|nr:hypothetical protein C8P63_105169 [Melghirimyces profundicolus]
MFGSGKFRYVGSLRSTRAFHDFKLDGLTFVQRFKAFFLNCGVMNENVVPAIALDETITFFRVEPLDFALHNNNPFIN